MKHSIHNKLRTRGHVYHERRKGYREAKRRVRRELDRLDRLDYGLSAGKGVL